MSQELLSVVERMDTFAFELAKVRSCSVNRDHMPDVVSMLPVIGVRIDNAEMEKMIKKKREDIILHQFLLIPIPKVSTTATKATRVP